MGGWEEGRDKRQGRIKDRVLEEGCVEGRGKRKGVLEEKRRKGARDKGR